MKPDCSSPIRRAGHPLWLAWAVVGIWLAGSSAALWALELKAARPALLQGPALAEWQPLPQAAEAWFANQGFGSVDTRGSMATVVHVYQPGCRCNTATDTHLSRIRREYAGSGVVFASVAQDALRESGAWRSLAAAPAALIFDAGGRLAYVGPYSDSARCGAAAGYVERVLAQLSRGEQPAPQPILTRGCYCSPASTRLSKSA
jgi:hypothetical protein